MSISSQNCKHIYQGDGTTRSWEIDFPFLSPADIAVYVTDADGSETQITTGYEVDLQNQAVIYPTIASGLSVLGSTQKITLLRKTPLTQEITLTQQGVLDASELEAGYDKALLQVQELAEQLRRAVKYTVSSGKEDQDAQAFLDELQATHQAALTGALAQIQTIETTLQAAMSTETAARQQGDLTLQQSVQLLSGTLAQKDAAQTQALEAEAAARLAADNALAEQISQLHFIEFVASLPGTGSSHYIYAVPQDETDLENHPIVVLYVWQNQWKAVGAFSTNIDPVSLLTKTEAASTYLTQTSAGSTYLPLSQKAAANGVASLDVNGKVVAGQIPYATSSTVGGIKQTFDATTGTWTVVTEDL